MIKPLIRLRKKFLPIKWFFNNKAEIKKITPPTAEKIFRLRKELRESLLVAERERNPKEILYYKGGLELLNLLIDDEPTKS